MIKVGFIDYFLDEWHANKYPGWFGAAGAALGTEIAVAYAWAELDASPISGVTTDAWCEKNGVSKCESIKELCEKSDVIVILSPDNPERHLDYAKEVLPYGKRTYIDKTFAPDYETALRIFDIAKQYGTPFFSTSALRYAEELTAMDAPDYMVTMGGGLLERYIVHQAEMVVAKLGTRVSRVLARKQGPETVFSVEFADGKRATMLHATAFGFFAAMAKEEGDQAGGQITSSFFPALVSDMTRFFMTGDVSFDPKQTLAVMKLIDLCLLAKKNPDTWVEM